MKQTLFIAATCLAMLALGLGLWALNDVPLNTAMLKDPEKIMGKLLLSEVVIIVTTGWFWRAKPCCRWVILGVNLASSIWLLTTSIGLLLT
jgi:hypothetical protein